MFTELTIENVKVTHTFQNNMVALAFQVVFHAFIEMSFVMSDADLTPSIFSLF